MVENAPVAYQVINGDRHAVSSRFVIGHDGQRQLPGRPVRPRPRSLVIDPVSSLVYSTYLGPPSSGNGMSETAGLGIAVDGAGEVYITGHTDFTQIPDDEGGVPSIRGFHQNRQNGTR